jgi:hypothetical protein
MISGGVPIEVVQMILGHSSPAVTRTKYAHLMKEAGARVVTVGSFEIPNWDQRSLTTVRDTLLRSGLR